MSMRNYANSGYAVLASKFTKLFVDKKEQEEFTQLLKDQACEEVEEMINSCLKSVPPVSTVFICDDETESDDLDNGEMYVVFDESNLFEKKETEAMKFLKTVNVKPEFASWVAFG